MALRIENEVKPSDGSLIISDDTVVGTIQIKLIHRVRVGVTLDPNAPFDRRHSRRDLAASSLRLRINNQRRETPRKDWMYTHTHGSGISKCAERAGIEDSSR